MTFSCRKRQSAPEGSLPSLPAQINCDITLHISNKFNHHLLHDPGQLGKMIILSCFPTIKTTLVMLWETFNSSFIYVLPPALELQSGYGPSARQLPRSSGSLQDKPAVEAIAELEGMYLKVPKCFKSGFHLHSHDSCLTKWPVTAIRTRLGILFNCLILRLFPSYLHGKFIADCLELGNRHVLKIDVLHDFMVTLFCLCVCVSCVVCVIIMLCQLVLYVRT